jgi:hypothetical protein
MARAPSGRGRQAQARVPIGTRARGLCARAVRARGVQAGGVVTAIVTLRNEV